MKKFLLGLGVVVILVACTSLLEPQSSTESLVIGSFSIYFYDVFYDHSQLIAAEGIKLFFTNLTQNRYFILATDRDGYYYYLTNGSDEYILTKFEYSTRFGTFVHTKSHPLNIHFSTSTAKLIYMGHSSITFSELVETAITIPSQYKVSLTVDWDRTEMLRYLENRQSDCCWLDYETIDNLYEVPHFGTEKIDN